MSNLKKNDDELKQKIKKILEGDEAKLNWDEKTVEELVSQISIYHQELEYQNDELKRVGFELENSRKHFFDLFEYAPVGYVIYDTELNLLSVNNKFCEYLHLTKNELLDRKFTDFIDPDSQDLFYFHIRRLMSIGTTTRNEIKLKYKDHFISASIESKLFEQAGKKFVQTAILDQTVEKEAKHKIAQNDAMYRALFENSNDAIYILYNRRFDLVNDKFCEMMEISRIELTKPDFDFMELVSQKSKKFIIERGEKEKQGESIPDRYQFTALTRRGEAIELDVSVKKIKYRDGYAIQGIVRDITQDKIVEMKLRESEARFRSIFDNINNIAVQGYSEDGMVHYWNNASEKLYGYKREEAIGKSLYDLIIPENMVEAVKLDVAKMFKSEAPIPSSELILKHKDGSDLHVYSNHTIINVLGRKKELYCIDVDLFKIKEAERQIKFQSKMLDEIGEAVIATDMEGKVIYWNNAAEKLYGWAKNEVLGKSITELTPAADLKLDADEIMLKLEGGKRWTGEFKLRRKDGTEFYALVTDAPLFDDSGDQIGIIGVSTNISTLKEAEAELRENNRFIEEVLDNLPIGIALNNMDDGFKTYNNKKFEEIYGWPTDELKSVDDFFRKVFPDENYRNTVGRKIMEDINSSERDRLYWPDLKVVSATGEEKIVIAQNIPLVERKTMVSTVIDITNQKKAEKALIESRRLNTIGEMSSAIAHDFNNSLQSILGNLDLMELKLEEAHPARTYIDSIKKSASDSASRIKILQRFAGNKKSTANFEILSLYQILEDVKNQSRPLWKDTAHKNGIEVKFTIDSDDEIYINGDEAELRSTFYNLVKNSIEALKNGGELNITTKISDRQVVLFFQDNGTGMDEETLSKVFQPFFTTKAPGKGRGLGMSSSFNVIKAHQGEIMVHFSKPGEGTVIKIVLPLCDAPEIKKAGIESESQLGMTTEKEIKILWVDDDPQIRGIAGDILNILGYTGEVVGSAHEALKILEEIPYSILLTDLGMPGMNGWELVTLVRKKLGDSIKIAILTGWGEEISKADIERHDINYVLSKPFKLTQINEMLKEMINITG